MTLTGLVKLLMEQFLPDIHQHYLFENYRQQQFYRASEIPGHKVTHDELLTVIQYYVPCIEM